MSNCTSSIAPADESSQFQAVSGPVIAQTTLGTFGTIMQFLGMQGAGSLLLQWQQRAGQRTHLGTLDDRLLKDIGLSRADIEPEVAKPFWRP